MEKSTTLINNSDAPNTNLDFGSFNVLNNSGFYVYFKVIYTINGETFHQSTQAFPYNTSKTIRFPKEVSYCKITVYMATFVGIWQEIYSQYYETPVQNCLMVYGTIFDPKCIKTDCPVGGTGGENNPDVPNVPSHPTQTPYSCNPCCCNCINILPCCMMPQNSNPTSCCMKEPSQGFMSHYNS